MGLHSSGSLIGGHQETATFVPDVYSRTQDEWISAFYSQNGYFDYSTMSRLGMYGTHGFKQSTAIELDLSRPGLTRPRLDRM